MKKPTNEDCSKRGEYLLQAYCDQYGGDFDNALRDSLADLMHWAARNEYDFDVEVIEAGAHFQAEIDEEAA